MSEYTEGTINLDDIGGGGSFIKEGRYTVELVAVNPTTYKSGLPGVDAIFEVQGGEFDGTSITKKMNTGIWPGKPNKDGSTGKSFAPGVADLKSILASVRAPQVKLNYKAHTHKDKTIQVADPQQAAKALGNALRGKKMGLAVIPETRKDTENPGQNIKNEDGTDKKFYNFKILGPVAGATTATDGESLGL